jgi:hypothetical protein
MNVIIICGTWYVHNLSKLQEIIEEVNSIKENIFCLTETKKGTAILNQFILIKNREIGKRRYRHTYAEELS